MNTTLKDTKQTTKTTATKGAKSDPRIPALAGAYAELLDLRKEADSPARRAVITRQLRKIADGLDKLGYDTDKLEPIPGAKSKTAALPVSAKTASALSMLKALEADGDSA